MKSNFEKVLEFHRIFGQPIGEYPGSWLDRDRENLRNGFIIEEFCELLVAQGYSQEQANVIQAVWDVVKTFDKPGFTDKVAIADACSDLHYFIYGSEVEYGIDADETFAEVHSSNLSKLDKNGNVLFRSDGKVMKSNLYFKPDLEKVLREQKPITQK